MSDTDLEILKLQIQREQQRADWIKWLIVLVWPLVLHGADAYFQRQAATAVTAKLDANAMKTDAVLTASDASVKNWKAFNTKQQGDLDEAQEAIGNAEKHVAEIKPQP